MKREFLEELGLEKSVIDSIMSEHGKSITSLKEQCRESEEKDAAISTLTKENGELKSRLDNEIKARCSFKEGIIDEMIAEASVSSSLAGAEVKRILLNCEDGKLKAKLNELMSSCPDAFVKDRSSMPVFSVSVCAETITPPVGYRRVR